MSEVKVQTLMLTNKVMVQCPHCNKIQDGFISNPVGGQFDCEDCNKTYKIHPEADIEYCLWPYLKYC
jgi:hypothetical protein